MVMTENTTENQRPVNQGVGVTRNNGDMNTSRTSVVRPPPVEEVVMAENTTENQQPDQGVTKERKKRGRTICKQLINLKPGQKLPIIFKNRRGAGPNGSVWSSYLGTIIRNSQMCPVRVKDWDEIGREELEHMWAAVKEYFTNPDMESAKEDVFDHMNEMWRTWRSKMNCKHVKVRDNLEDILGDVPRFLNKEDWEWVVKEKFLSKEFLEISKRNEENIAKKTMNQHSGRKPVRQIGLDLTEKLGRAPTVAELVFDTYKEGDIIKDVAANARHVIT
ncbi:unnamed protein product [Linum tenue]|uniref:Transposon protein, putative, CACTA, En/Spm sub-class n=1 Tax=Linum tenue TaxID=586396 RepID=A0AAV0MFE2_9ROSI|nr:unnamed protein product [Linum tenue]